MFSITFDCARQVPLRQARTAVRAWARAAYLWPALSGLIVEQAESALRHAGDSVTLQIEHKSCAVSVRVYADGKEYLQVNVNF